MINGVFVNTNEQATYFYILEDCVKIVYLLQVAQSRREISQAYIMYLLDSWENI